MAHLIDKDALVAEIEKRKNMFYDMSKGCEDASSAKAGFYAQAQTLEGILSFLNSLEVKEVDLEKEIKESITDEWCDEWSSDVGNWIRDRRGTTSMTVEDVKDIAKHFFQLGLNVRIKAQKGEEYGSNS